VNQGQCNSVDIGSNKSTGELVAIKAIDTVKYKKLAHQN
jgi:hypothetical protein